MFCYDLSMHTHDVFWVSAGVCNFALNFWFRHACVLVFRKMFFLIHFIFTFLAGKIYRPLFTTFYPLFVIIFHEKITFFHVKHMVLHLMFDEFLSPHYTFIASTATLCSSQWFTTFYACYSTRCSLNLLKNKGFLHSMHVIALDVCWISFLNKTCFLISTSWSSLFSIVYHTLCM